MKAEAPLLDAGCGDGQHAFPLWWRWRGRLTGVDRSAANVRLCQQYAKVRRLKAKFQQLDLQVLNAEKQDLIWCVGTLQYVEDDVRALRRFADALKPDGQLLIYSPINGRILLGLYRRMLDKLPHYEVRQGRQRIYTESELQQKLRAAGFAVRFQRYTYGWLGILAHELLSICLLRSSHAESALGLTIGIMGLILVSPIVLLLHLVDVCLPKTDGNGLLLICELRDKPLPAHSK